MVPTYYYTNTSISFVLLYNLLSSSQLRFEGFINYNGFSCYIEPFIDPFDLISCDCTNNSTEGECNDDGLETAQAIGSIWLCPGVDITVGVPPGAVTSQGDQVSGTECKFLIINLASSASFVGNRERESLTVFGDPNDLDPYPVRNEKGASVGRVLSNGISFSFIEEYQLSLERDVLQVYLSFVVNFLSSELDNVPGDFVIDFGYEVTNISQKYYKNEIELRPLNAQGSTLGITVDQARQLPSFSANGAWVSPFSHPSLTRVYPIARMVNWEEEDTDNLLTSGEKAMMGVFCGLYGLSCVLSIVGFFLVFVGGALSLSVLMLFFFVILTFLFRCILCGLFASGHYDSATDDYFGLLEPPSFFVFSILTVLIMSYWFCVKAAKGKATAETFMKYWKGWLLSQLFIYLVMAAVFILLNELDTDDDVVTYCFGRTATVKENDTVQYIRIAYHSLLLFLAIICAIMELKLGIVLKESLEKDTLLVLSVLGGVSVVSNCLLWVVYSAASGSTPYFVIPLFMTEAPPLLAITYLVLPARRSDYMPDVSHTTSGH